MMTSKFDSFDESNAGAFVESPAGARNVVTPGEEVVYIYFAHKTMTGYVSTQGDPLATYDGDLDAWLDWRQELVDGDVPVTALLIQQPNGQGNFDQLIPDGRSFPRHVSFRQTSPRRSSLSYLRGIVLSRISSRTTRLDIAYMSSNPITQFDQNMQDNFRLLRTELGDTHPTLFAMGTIAETSNYRFLFQFARRFPGLP